MVMGGCDWLLSGSLVISTLIVLLGYGMIVFNN